MTACEMSVPLPQARPSKLALSAFVCGLLAFALWFVLRMPAPLLGGMAILLAAWAFRAIRRSGGRVEGAGVAAAGLALGVVKLGLVVATLFLTETVTFT